MRSWTTNRPRLDSRVSKCRQEAECASRAAPPLSPFFAMGWGSSSGRRSLAEQLAFGSVADSHHRRVLQLSLGTDRIKLRADLIRYTHCLHSVLFPHLILHHRW